MDAKIHRPGRSAMQAGRAKTHGWVLEFLDGGKRSSDPLMGWTSIDDTASQVQLTFDTRDEAIAYARRHNLTFRVEEPREPRRMAKSYAGNFAANRKQPWTH